MKTVCKQRHFDSKPSFLAKSARSWRTTDITRADPETESNATVHEIRNHPVVNLNGISTGQSIQSANVAVADNADVLLREIAPQLAELNGKISSIGLQPSGSPLPERQGASAAVLRSIGTQELQEWPRRRRTSMRTWILWNTKCRKKACSCDSAKGKSGGQVAASNHLRLAEVKGDNVVCSLPVPSTALHL